MSTSQTTNTRGKAQQLWAWFFAAFAGLVMLSAVVMKNATYVGTLTYSQHAHPSLRWTTWRPEPRKWQDGLTFRPEGRLFGWPFECCWYPARDKWVDGRGELNVFTWKPLAVWPGLLTLNIVIGCLLVAAAVHSTRLLIPHPRISVKTMLVLVWTVAISITVATSSQDNLWTAISLATAVVAAGFILIGYCAVELSGAILKWCTAKTNDERVTRSHND